MPLTSKLSSLIAALVIFSYCNGGLFCTEHGNRFPNRQKSCYRHFASSWCGCTGNDNSEFCQKKMREEREPRLLSLYMNSDGISSWRSLSPCRCVLLCVCVYAYVCAYVKTFTFMKAELMYLCPFVHSNIGLWRSMQRRLRLRRPVRPVSSLLSLLP